MSLPPPRPFVEVLREALQTLQTDPGPRTPEKLKLMEQIRCRIADDESSQEATAPSQPARLGCAPPLEW